MNWLDSISAVVLLSFSMGFCFQASRYPFGTISKIGPGFLPFILGITLTILSFIILVRTLLQQIKDPSTLRSTMTHKKVLRVVSVLFCMVGYAFLLGKLGFPITTFLFTLVLFKFVESYGWISSILGALSASVASYLIFIRWLQCQFPNGFFGI